MIRDANQLGAIQSHRSLLSQAPGHLALRELTGPQRHPLYRRKRRKVAQAAREVRPLAHGLYPDERLGEVGSPGAGFRSPAAGTDPPGQERERFARQHVDQGSSRRDRGFKKNGPQSIGRSRGGLTTKVHLVAANERTALCFSLSAGQCADGPEGRKLLSRWTAAGKPRGLKAMIMDRAYEADETRQLVLSFDLEPVVPPKSNRWNQWEYDKELYKKRNEVERLFRRLKGFRRIFSRFEKLDVMFIAFLHVALIFTALLLP